jgi:hypothetical protein
VEAVGAGGEDDGGVGGVDDGGVGGVLDGGFGVDDGGFGVDEGGLGVELGAAVLDGGYSVVYTVVFTVVVSRAVYVAVDVAVPPTPPFNKLLQNNDASAVCPANASSPHRSTSPPAGSPGPRRVVVRNICRFSMTAALLIAASAAARKAPFMAASFGRCRNVSVR